MPAEKAEIVRRWTDAFNRRDFDAMAAYLDPGVELHEWPTAPGARVYHGPDGARAAIDNWFEVWEWVQIEIEDIVENDDQVVVTLHQRARGRASEIEVEITSHNVYTFRGSTITRIQLFTEEEPALEAAGLAVTGDNVAAKVRHGYEAFNRGDYEAFMDILDPDVEWDHSPATGAPEEGVYRGREEVLRLLERLRDAWEEQTFHLEDVVQTGSDEYVVTGIVRATGKISGVALDARCEYAMKLRDGKATRVRFTLTGPASRPDVLTKQEAR